MAEIRQKLTFQSAFQLRLPLRTAKAAELASPTAFPLARLGHSSK